MKVVAFDRYGGPDVLTLRDWQRPAPGPGEVLIAVDAVVVGPGDCKLRAGDLRGFFEVSFPKVPGRYGVGRITAAGDAQQQERVGQAVVFSTLHAENGCCAEYVVRRAEKAVRIPADVKPIEIAALVQSGVCAYVGVVDIGGVEAGARLLVHGGAGAVGSAAVRLGRHLGARVTATCRSSDADYVRALGADDVVAFDRQDFAAVVRDQDVVLDTLGGETHARSYAVLKRGAKLIYLNAAPIEDCGAEYGVRVINARIDDRPQVLEAVCDLAHAGVFRGDLGAVLPLADAAEAHRLVEAGAIKRGRVLLSVP